MSVVGKVEGVPGLLATLRALPKEAANPIRAVIRGGALAVEREARQTIQRGSRSGRIYQKYSPKRIHVASAPGEPPKTDTGYLAGHIVSEVDTDGFGASVESRAEYSKPLELGSSNMAARPFLFPSLERWKPRIRERLLQAWYATRAKYSR